MHGRWPDHDCGVAVNSRTVLVTGSRTWANHDLIDRRLSQELENWILFARSKEIADPDWCLIVGDAAGADRMAHDWAIEQIELGNRRVTTVQFRPDWDTYGKRAGLIRNKDMVNAKPDICLAFIAPCTNPRCFKPGMHGTHGATQCAREAIAAGIQTTIERAWWPDGTDETLESGR